MIIKNLLELERYKEACKISTEILWQLHQKVKIGVVSIEVDDLAFSLCKKYNVKPCFYGVGDIGNEYKNATCISINDTVVHGIPNKEVFKNGDIVKVDFGISYKGFNTDHCFSLGLGEISKDSLRLLEVGKEAIWRGANEAVAGKRVGDIGFAINDFVVSHGVDTVKEYTGHGIGKILHDDPIIPSFGARGFGRLIKENMMLCIEAQFVKLGDDEVFTENDGWTVKTVKGNYASMFELMVLAGSKPEILTKDTYSWDIIRK